MHNHFRDYRNDNLAVIFGLAIGCISDSVFEKDLTTAVIIAFAGAVVFRIFISYSPWSEAIKWDSDENIYSTPWQPMTTSQEVSEMDNRS